MKDILRKPWRIFSIAVLLAGAGWIWLSAAPPGGTTNGGIPAPRMGFLAPDFSLQTLQGDALGLPDLQGRPLIINVWASWCTPCKAEMPALERVYQRYRDQGLVVLAVNATNQDSVAAASTFVQDHGLTFPVLLDLDGSVTRLYQVSAFPSSFFVDRQGVIREVVIGGPMSEALLRIRAEQLLE